MRLLLRIITIFFALSKVQAQANHIIIESAIDSFIDLREHVYIFADTSKEATFEDVSALHNKRKLTLLKNYKWPDRYDRGRYPHWYIVDLENQMPSNQHLNLHTRYVRKAEIYIINSNAINIDTITKLQNQYPKHKGELVISLAANETTRLILKHSSLIHYSNEPFQLYNQLAYKDFIAASSYIRYLYYGFFFGALIILFSLYFFRSLFSPDQSNIYFSLFILSIFLFFLREISLGEKIFTLAPSWLAEFQYYLPLTLLTYIFNILFLVHFLNAKKEIPVLFKYMKIVFPFFGIWFIVDRIILQVDVWWAWEMMNTIKYIFWLSSFYVIYHIYKSKAVLAKYFLISSLVTVLSTILIMLISQTDFRVIFGWLDITNLISHIAILIGIITYALGLGVKSKLIHQEKINLENKWYQSQIENNAIKEINENKVKFYNQFTHDFKTPLSLIQNAAEELDREPSIKEMILKNSNYLLNLIDDVLQHAHLNTKEENIEHSIVDIYQLIKVRAHQFESTFNFEHKILNIDVPKGTLYASINRNNLLRIIDNLIHNALKFTKAGDQVNLQLTYEKSELSMLISDTGIGIKKEELPFIFEEKFQGEGFSKTKGFGIGLSTVRSLVQKMNGTISCTSTHHEGTQFKFVLPVIKSFDPEEVFIPKTASKDENQLILIVEDHPDLSNYLRNILIGLYKIEIAANGREALELIYQTPPDLIISDVMMPIMDGIELCRAVKQNEMTNHIPFIFLTALSNQDHINQGLSLGAEGYLTKPFHKKEIILRIRNLFESQKKLQKIYRGLISRNSEPIKLNNPQVEFFKNLNRLILDTIEDPSFGIVQLSHALSTNRVSLNKKVKFLTGYSIGKYIRKVKLEFAKEKVLHTDNNFSEIAYSIGIYDSSNFTKLFKSEFNLTPKELRNKSVAPNVLT